MSDSDYSDSETEFDLYDEDEDIEDEDDELFQEEELAGGNPAARMAGERFVEKRVVYEGGLSTQRLSMSELVHLVSVLAQTYENNRPARCDISLIAHPEITPIDIAIAEIRQKVCPYLIMREHLGGVFEIIDPNQCTFNEQDIKEQYLHNTEKTFDTVLLDQ
jgi:hypothetical protein